MSLTTTRAFYSGDANTKTAFTVPASKQWLVHNLTYRITVDSGTPTALQIEHRDSGGTIIAILTRETSFNVQAESVDATGWNGITMEAGDVVKLTGGDAGSTPIEVEISYEEQA